MLRLLEMTPATATQIRRASVTFPGEPFRDDRRVRERLQALSGAGFTRSVSAGLTGGGLLHHYRLAVNGFRAIHPDSNEPFPRLLSADIAPSRIQHATTTADVIVHTLVSCDLARVKVTQFSGDGRLTLEAGEYCQQPDCHFQLEFAGMFFNLLFEIDNATEPLDSRREQSIRTKILGYETYQDWVLRVWNDNGRPGIRPSFRVILLAKGAERANHILWLAHSLVRNKDRCLVYASTQDQYLGSATPLTHPIFNDHFGQWQALLNPTPTSGFTLRPPIRLRPPVAPSTVV